MDKAEGERFQSSDRLPRRSVENMENFSKYLAEMFPQEKVTMKRNHQQTERLLEDDSDPTRNKLSELFELFRNTNIYTDYLKGIPMMNGMLAVVENFGTASADFNQTNATSYKCMPYKYVEQRLEYFFPVFAQDINPEMIDMSSYLKVKVLGSTVDGLAVPFALHREDKSHNIPMDLDVMVVLSPPYFPTVTSRRDSETTTQGPLWLKILSPPYYPTVTSRREAKTTTKGSFVVDGRGCHPGYVKLKVQGQHWLFEEPDVLERDRGGIYLSNRCVLVYTQKANSSPGLLKKIFEKLRTRTHPHGPAMTYEIPFSFYAQDDLVMSGDIVASFPLNEFPREAHEWLSRKRESGWPNMEQIRAVKELGCHLVPVANPGNRDSRIEWRISFVLAERHLAMSLNQVQRHVYRIIKLIHKHRLGESCMLSSYHLKTTLFWLCEHIPQDRWTNEEMGQRFYDFYDLLLDFLHKKCIPNYFIPENNMIDYLDVESVSAMANILHTVLINPKATLMEIQAKYNIHFCLMDPAFLKRLLQSFFRMGRELIVDSSENDLDSIMRIFGGAVDALSKNDSDNLLRKEDEDSDGVMGAVGGEVDAFSKNDSDNPLKKEKEEEECLAELHMKKVFRVARDFFGSSAFEEDITEEMANLGTNTLLEYVKPVVFEFIASTEDQSLVELLEKTTSMVKECFSQLKQTPAKEHAGSQKAASKEILYLRNQECDGQHNAKGELVDEDQFASFGNKKNWDLELFEKLFDQLDLELKQRRAGKHVDDQKAGSREMLYLKNDDSDDQGNAKRESVDFSEKDQIAPSGNEKEFGGKLAGQLKELDLD